MKTILLAGYKSSYDSEFCDLLNRQLEGAFRLSPEPIVVLAGESADQILRHCRRLERCELVFDTHGSDASVWTNLKAALEVTEGLALIQLIDTPWPEASAIQAIRNELLREGRSHSHLIQALTSQGDLVAEGFPLGLTLSGLQFLKRVKNLQSLVDESISYKWIYLPNLPKRELSPTTGSVTCHTTVSTVK